MLTFLLFVIIEQTDPLLSIDRIDGHTTERSELSNTYEESNSI